MSNDPVRILAAEADASIREIIKYAALGEGWATDEAGDGIAAVKLLRRKAYQAAILSCDLPTIDGYMVFDLTREQLRCPVIFIGKSGSEEERLAAFEAGGNDYLQKPFFPRELLARMRNLMGLYGAFIQKRDTILIGPIRVERHSQNVFLYDHNIWLTPREYNLLVQFCQNPGRAFSRAELLNAAWGPSFEGGERTVDTHVKSLREKLRPYHEHIKTIWGFGYKFEE